MRVSFRSAAFIAAAAVVAVLFAPLDAAVRPPKIQYTMSTLPNGLRVILSEDHSTPIVHVRVTYHVGSKNERPGLTGFAHLFEHMMFKGSKNLEPEAHTSIISSVGGRANAYTTEDETVFWQTLPSHYLPLVLWMEADRMATLRVDEDAFRREVEVVKEERRMRVDNQPYGRLSELINDNAFTTFPYKHPTIGSMADLEAASIADVRQFHQTFYVPENAVVAIVGDFDSAVAQQLVTQYFGRVPKAAMPVPRDIPKEPMTKAEKRVTVEDAVPLPAVVVAYHITYDGHPDSYPLHITSKIMSDGDSARITRTLIYDQRLCLSAFASGNITEDPNLFFAVCIVQPGQTVAAAERAMINEFEKLKTGGVTAQEVERAQNQFARDYIVGRESNEEKALHLSHAAVIHNDITTADGEFDIFMQVTPADVQRVARTYFNAENRFVMTIMPLSAGGSR
jgi:zinc protease